MIRTFDRSGWVFLFIVLACASMAGGAVLHVSTEGSATPPYEDWTTAATDVQSAVNAATSGDTVLVAAGTYILSSPILITNGITVRSAQGAATTVLNGNHATRCVAINHPAAVLNGFTVTGGLSDTGGGVYCASGALVEACFITGNYASAMDSLGGGLFLESGGTARSCLVTRNYAGGYSAAGGGVFVRGAILLNCTICDNDASAILAAGGGVALEGNSVVDNCIITGNHRTLANTTSPDNWYVSSGTSDIRHTCAAPLPAGEGNMNTDPGFMSLQDADYRLFPTSACVNSGVHSTWADGAFDLDGEPRTSGSEIDVGCYEYPLDRPYGRIHRAVRAGTTPFQAVMFADVTGMGDPTSLFYSWDFNDDGAVDLGGQGNLCATNTYYSSGLFSISLLVTNIAGDSLSLVQPGLFDVAWPVAYVSTNGMHTPPFTTWDTAATNIQDAVDVLEDGGTVLVSNGTYGLSRQIEVAKAITVKGVGGAWNTTVDGNNVCRGFKITHPGAVVDGFTITRGNGAFGYYETCGGGVYCSSGTVQNCVIRRSNSGSSHGSPGYGGGVYLVGGRLINCLIGANTADPSPLSGLCYGGGIYLAGGTIDHCTIVENVATVKYSCVSAPGGTWCDPVSGGAVFGSGLVRNSIVYGNFGHGNVSFLYTASEIVSSTSMAMSVQYTCTPDSWGIGVTNVYPGFLDVAHSDFENRDLRLASYSPCIDAGTTEAAVATDLNGLPRPLDGNQDGQDFPDMGAFEYFDPRIMADATVTISPTLAAFSESSPAQVLFTSSLPGDIRYTTNGGAPSESDPLVPESGLLSITNGMVLRARLFLCGTGGPVSTGRYYAASTVIPVMTGISPANADTLGGSDVLLVGTNFGRFRGNGQVWIGGYEASRYIGWSEEWIRFVAPAHATGYADIVVMNDTGFSATNANALNFVRLNEYDVGDIPDVPAPHGTSTVLYVFSSEVGEGADYRVDVFPTPGGTVSFDPAERKLTYTPNEFDINVVFVTITASKDGRTASQTIRLQPQPKSADEVAAFGLAPTRAVPDETSRDYIFKVETTNDTTEYFNAFDRQTRTVLLAGRKLVFEPGHASGLYDSFSGNENIKRMQIDADTVIIRAPLNLPETEVIVHARELRFEDTGAQAACINTTPKSITMLPDPGTDGRAGHPAGNVSAYVQKFYSGTGTTARFVMQGGDGEPAGMGQDGASGTSMGVVLENGVVGKATYYDYVEVNFFGGETHHVTGDANQWPGNGANALPGGIPGDAADGGNLVSSLDLHSYAVNSGGHSGQKAPDTMGGAAGTPSNAVRVCLYMYWNGMDTGYIFLGSHTSHPGLDAISPDSIKKVGFAGTFEQQASAYAWLTPLLLRQTISWVKDAYLYGHLDFTASVLDECSSWIEDFRARPEWNEQADDARNQLNQIYDEMLALRFRIVSHLDYVGNPAGWVPMLSFEVNRAAFDQEIDNALRVLYLAYWINHAAVDLQAKTDGLVEMRLKASDDIEACASQYSAANAVLPGIQTKLASLTGQVAFLQTQVADVSERLSNEASNNVKKSADAAFAKSVVKTVANVVSVLPWGQPALGIIGQGVSVLMDVDFEAIGRDPKKLGDLKPTLDKLVALGDKNNSDSLTKGAEQLTAAFTNLDLVHILTNVVVTTPTNAVTNCVGSTCTVITNYLCLTNLQVNAATIANLTTIGNKLSDPFNQVMSLFQGAQIPEGAVATELEKLKSESPDIKRLANDLANTMAQQQSAVSMLNTALERIATLKSQIGENVLAIDAFSRSISQGVQALDPTVLTYIQGMERRARERLFKYHYYMAKAYEYRMLEPYPGDLNMNVLLDKCSQIVSGGGTCVLTPVDFDALKALYEDQLSSITAQIFDLYNANRPELSVPLRFSLGTNELAELNSGNPVALNMVDRGFFQLNEENIRIVDFTIYSMGAHLVGSSNGVIAYCDINATHSGESRLRHNGQDLFFHHYSDNTDNPIVWGGRYDYYWNVIDPISPSAASESLLRSLLAEEGIGQTDENILLYSQPAAWADLEITKDVLTDNGADIVIDNMTFELEYDFVRMRSDQAVLNVLTEPQGFLPAVLVSSTDLYGRQNGYGSFFRTYTKGVSVNVTAPAWYGKYQFVRWSDRYGNPLPFGNPTNTLLTVPLSQGRAVQANYTYVEFPDQNGDGVEDWWEDCYFNMLNVSLTNDADGDGLDNGQEYGEGSNPTAGDTDEDGMDDGDESIAGTSATNSSSMFLVDGSTSPSGGNRIIIQWASASNRLYGVWRTTNSLAPFEQLQVNIPATPPMNTFTDSFGTAGTMLYKVRVRKQ